MSKFAVQVCFEVEADDSRKAEAAVDHFLDVGFDDAVIDYIVHDVELLEDEDE